MQAPTYTFDPYNWATITPMLDELCQMSVSADSFMEWLDQWNQLDIDVWDAYTQLKHPAYVDTTNQAAEDAYQAYVKDLYSTYIDYTQRLIMKALKLQPEAPTPRHQHLWRRWRNQVSLHQEANLPILAEISQLENQYRSIMWDDDGTPTYWLNRRESLNDLMLQLLKLRRTLAQNSGVSTYLEYRWRELNRLDYSIEDCQSFHRAVENMIPEIAMFRASGKWPKQTYPEPEVTDNALLERGAERILRQIDPAFGDIFRAMQNGYLDLGGRPNKAISNESWFFSGAGMPYIHIATGNASSLFHESGHGIHDYLSFQAQGSLWNSGGPEVFQEFAANSMDMLCWPYYGKTEGGLYDQTGAIMLKQSVLELFLGGFCVNCVMQDAFEHWVYGEAPEDVTADDLDAKWLEVQTRYQPWDNDYGSDIEKITGWQRDKFSLFRYPLYMITYSMAAVGACQMIGLTETNQETVVANFKTALTLGNTQPLATLFQTVGLTFPFRTQDVQETVYFIFDQIEQSNKEKAALK